MKIVHVLPHAGGGAETYIDLLERLDGVSHRRVALAADKTLRHGGSTIPLRWPGVARATLGADVVHAHGDTATVLALPLIAARPSVWTPQGLHMLRRVDGAAGTAFRASLRAAVAVTAATLCSSEAERADLAAIVAPRHRDRLRLIHNGTDVASPTTDADRRTARRELDIAEEGTVALLLGELDGRKDPLTAVRAAETADVTLLVAGDGAMRPTLEALASERVRVLGFRTDLERLFAAADVLLMPSLREGMSFALLAAMGHGLAMIVSDGAGNGEAVGEAGIVVPVGDVEGFAAALRRVGPKEGAAARERARKVFGVDGFLEGVRHAYGAAVGAESPASAGSVTAPGRGGVGADA